MTTPVIDTTHTANSTVNNGQIQLNSDYNTFLQLLTTQLKNQDPLSPLDTNQFTQQLTQMSGVEQQLLGNQLLQTLVTQQGISQGAHLIGMTISAPGANSGDPTINGVVTAVQQVDGQTVLSVGDSKVPLSSVTSVSQTPSGS